jgi:hypothetical protein
MSDVDSNGVDVLDRFRAYSERFRQFSVAEEVYLDTLEYIKLVRKERDEARREVCEMRCDSLGACISGSITTPQQYADRRGWDCFRNYKKSQEALDKLSELDEELGLQ